MNENEADIRAVIDERTAAMRDKDAARTVATLASDVVVFELAPPLSVGAQGARDVGALAAWLQGWDGPLGIEIRDLHIETAGAVGWSRSLNRLHGRLKDGREVDMWMRSTLGFRKIGGAWKIAHGHSSVPFLMDGTYRAALQLAPED